MSLAIRPDQPFAGLVFNTWRIAPFNVVWPFRNILFGSSESGEGGQTTPNSCDREPAGIRNCTPACRAVSAADREPGTTLPGGPIRSFLQSVIVLLVSRYAGLVVRVRLLVGAGFFFEHSREG